MIKGAKIESVKDGNTSKLTRRPSQMYQWFFTLNNYNKNDIISLKMRFNKMCKWWIFEEEIGKEGTPHLQGNISLIKKLRFTSIAKWDRRIHWEATRNVEAAIEYCKKETKIYTNTDLDEFNEYEKVDWKCWQKEIIKEVEKKCDDDRKINWIWDDDGNTGKSYLTKYLMRVENALVVEGKKSDIFYQIAKRREESLSVPLVIIDVPRSSFNNISYSAIECIKNGLISSGKYEGGQYTFKSPHVYVFANCEPDVRKFSKDRWRIKKIENYPPPAPLLGGSVPHSRGTGRNRGKVLYLRSRVVISEHVINI